MTEDPYLRKAGVDGTAVARTVSGVLVLLLGIGIALWILVLIARVSFAGTALMAPMVFAAVLLKNPPRFEIIIATLIGLLLFLGSMFGIVPCEIGFLRLDMLLLIGLAVNATVSMFVRTQGFGRINCSNISRSG